MSTKEVQKEIEEALQTAGIRSRVKTLIGGLAASKEWAEEIGADGWAETAVKGVEEAISLLKAS